MARNPQTGGLEMVEVQTLQVPGAAVRELVLAAREGGRGLVASSLSIHCKAADADQQQRKNQGPWRRV